MANYETKLSFGVDLKGAKSAQQALDELNQKAIDNAKKQKQEASALADELAKAAEEARRAAEVVVKSGAKETVEHKRRIKEVKEAAREKARAATDAGRAQEAAIKKVKRLEDQDHVQKLRRAAALERDAERARDKESAADARASRPQPVTSAKQGAFGQGFLQGVMPGGLSRFIDRGPGAGRQAAGIVAGDMLSSLASIPFAGAGALTGAAGALGSFVGAPVSQMFGNTGNALSRQRAQLGMMPYLGGYGTQAMAGTGGIANLSDADLRAQAAREGRAAGNPHLVDAGRPGLLSRHQAGAGDINPYLNYVRGSGSEEQRIASAQSRLEHQRDMDRNAGPGANGLRDLGRMYGGRTLSETQQFVTQMAMRAGGQGSDLGGQGLVEAGLAANTKYGISADVAGAYGRAGRNGGILGGEGNDAGFARMIGNAVKLGLTGSDLTKFAEQTAQTLSAFEASGIPLAPGAIAGAANAFGAGGVGLAAPRAASAGLGVVGAVQQAGMSGTQDAFGVAMLQALGGSESYGGQLDAEREMRNPTASTINKILGGLTSRVVDGGQGKYAHKQLMNMAMRLQLPTDDASIDKYQAYLKAGRSDFATGEGAPFSVDDLKASARAMTPSALGKEASQQDKQTDLGESAVGSSQAANAAATAVAGLYADALAPVLRGVATALTSLTGFLEGHKAVKAAAD
jgi:hypothetical protein